MHRRSSIDPSAAGLAARHRRFSDVEEKYGRTSSIDAGATTNGGKVDYDEKEYV